MPSSQGALALRLASKRQLNVQQTQTKQYHIAHILIKTHEGKDSQAMLDKTQQIKQRLKEGEDFAKLAVQYSEDTSRTQGGDIGWIGLGKTVQPFEDAFLKLAIDEVSQPIQTQFGWHLIKVLGVRTYNAQEETLKSIVRQQLIEQNAEEVFSDYLQQLRHAAYIEKRLPLP